MKPYYSEKGISIYNADCRDVLPYLEPAHLVVTSPPYDELRGYHGFEWQFPDTAAMLWHLMLPGGVVVWIVGDQTSNGSETGSSFKQALEFLNIGFNLHDTMIYEKCGTRYPDTIRYFQCFEFMFVLSKGSPKSVNLICDKLNTSVGRTVTGTERRKNGSMTDSRSCYGQPIQKWSVRTNIWRVPHCDKSRNLHPATFPESLAFDHIYSWSKESDCVVDPFMGSGTTLCCAKQLNRKAVGIEISEEYCEVAANRLRQNMLTFAIDNEASTEPKQAPLFYEKLGHHQECKAGAHQVESAGRRTECSQDKADKGKT